MNSRIENESGGKYLYIETTAERDGFESKMAESLISEHIITPSLIYAYGGMCLEYNITGLSGLDEYLSGIRLNSLHLVRLIAQIEQCVNTIKNYLLSESDLLLDAEYVYIDAAGGILKFCIVPGYNGNFEHELRRLIGKLLVHIDAEDDNTLRLGFRLYRAVSEDDCKLHDLMTVLKGAGVWTGERAVAAAGARTETVQFAGSNTEYDRSLDHDMEYLGADVNLPHDTMYGSKIEMEANPEHGRLSTEYDDYAEETEPEVKPHSLLRETLTGLLISQAILVGVAAAVFLLKGRASLMRLIPIYIIIALCLTVYYVISFLMKRKQAGV